MDGIISWFEFVADNFDDVLALSGEHLLLTFAPVILAIVVSVGLGILFRHRPAIQNLNLAVAGVFLTIPSLALFSISIPIVGIGFWPAFIALFLYAILPILRNTATGLAEVDPAVLESARGMGLSATERLWKIELPLAWPVILAGIRISMLLTFGIAAIGALVDAGGLGEFIAEGTSRFPLPTSVERVWTGSIFILVLALVTDRLLALMGRFTTSKGLA